MTQALLNNLSTISDLSTKLTSLKDNVNAMDFQKVFEKQTNTQEKNLTTEDVKEQSTTEVPSNNENTFDNLETIRQSSSEQETDKTDDTDDIDNKIVEEIEIEPNTDVVPDEEIVTIEEETENQETENVTETPVYENFLTGAIIDFVQPKQSSTKENSVDGQPEKMIDTNNDDISLKSENASLDSILESFAAENEEVCQIKTKESGETSEKTLEEIVDEDVLNELNIESVEAETSDDKGSDLMQNQSPQEQGIKALIQADIPEFSEVKTNEVQATAKTSTAQEIANPSKIIEQISKQMEGMKSGSRVNMILNPESLGKVEIQLINTKEGLSAQFTVATQDAKNLLLKGLDGLKETLAMHGVSIDNVSVKLNESQESKYNSDWTEQENSKGGNKEQNSGREKRDKSEFEQAMSDFNEENGNV